MRILLVNPVGQIGGAERVLLDCIALMHQQEDAYDIHLLQMDHGPLEDAARVCGAKVHVLPLPQSVGAMGDSQVIAGGGGKASLLIGAMRSAPAMWKYVRNLKRAVREIAPDVIHSNGLKSHLMLALANVGLPVIWHVHDFVGARPMVAGLLRRLSRGVTPVAISESVAEDIRTWLPGSSPRVLLNGIDLSRFAPGPGDGAKLDALAGAPVAPLGTIRIGLIATYARWKGQDLFLKSAAQVMRDRPDLCVRFYIIGGAIYTTRGSQFSRDELMALADALGVSDRVVFVPFQTDPVEVYRSLDIVVHASTRPEPFGLTIAEAMACGKAVIVSAAGGACELFTDGVDALGVNPDNPAALATTIAHLAANEKIRAELSDRAFQTAKDRFPRQKMHLAWEDIYQEAASKTDRK